MARRKGSMKADAIPKPGVGKVQANYKTPLGPPSKKISLSRKPRPK